MAEPVTAVVPESTTVSEKDTEVDTLTGSEQADGVSETAVNVESNTKRAIEEGDEGSVEFEQNGGAAKMQKVESEEKLEGGSDANGVRLGPKHFGTSVEVFNYFFKFLRYWPPNINVNKFEYMVLLELLKKGHLESEKKIGAGVRAFQVRYHPQFKSRCFFLIRDDDSIDDFSFRKCVDHILPLPENMKVKSDKNKSNGGGGGGGGTGGRGYGGGGGGCGGRGGGRGRGRGGRRSRN